MADKLPSEILKKISIDLSPNDLYAAVRVCHSWNIAFIPTLYGVVDIRSYRQFKRFIATLRDSENLNARGHLLRILKLSFDFGVPSESDYDYNVFSKNAWKKYNLQFKLLFRLCPFVVEFNSCNGWSPAALENLQEWKHLTKLPSIVCQNPLPASSLDFFRNRLTRLTIACAEFSEWKDVVTELPCIENLTLTYNGNWLFDSSYSSPDISILDLERIHKALRFLRSLTVGSLYLRGEIPNDITPCGTVHELDLRPNSGYLWGRYVARKYTALETLKISFTGINDEINEAELMTLIKPCRHLKRFEYESCSDGFVGFNRQILDALHETDTTITRLTVHGWDVLSYATIVSHFYKTLSRICFHDTEINDFLGPLKQCSSLVELFLWDVHDVYIDCILDHCKYLKNLDISNSRIRVSNSYDSDSQHGLRRLYLSNGDVSDETFAYLSQHCPRLIYLRYRHSDYYSDRTYPRCTKSTTMHITSPSLKALHVSYGKKPCVFKLTRLDKPKRIRSKSRRYHESAGTYQVKYWTRWYHHCTDEGETFRRLNASEIVKLSDQPRKNDSRYHTNELQKDSGDQIASDNIHDISIVSIYCSSADIYLEERRII